MANPNQQPQQNSEWLMPEEGQQNEGWLMPEEGNPASSPASKLDVAKANIAKYPQQEAAQDNHIVGQMVPQFMTPYMKSFSESYPVRKSEELGQKGAQLGEKAAMDYLAGAAAPPGAMGMPAPAGSYKPTTPEQIEQQHPIMSGVAKGVGGFVGGTLGDPRQLALMVGSMGSSEAFPILSKLMSGGFGAQMGAHVVGGTKDLIGNWDKLTPEQRAQQITDLGLSAYLTKEAIGHTGVPQAFGEMVAPEVNAGIRGASTMYNRAHEALPTTGAVVGGMAGGISEHSGISPGGAAYGTYVGGRAGKILQRMLPKAPESMTTRGMAPVDVHIDKLSQALNQAKSDYAAAQKEAEPYQYSRDQYGVQPPAKIAKNLEKAQKALNEAQFHYDAAVNSKSGAAPVNREPDTNKIADYMSGRRNKAAGDEASNIRNAMVPAKEAAGMYTPPPTPANVKGPGEIPREIVNPSRAQGFENLGKPEMPPFSQDIPLANQEGVRMGNKPGVGGATVEQKALPPADTGTMEPQAPQPQAKMITPAERFDVQDIRTKMVPAKTRAGMYETPKDVEGAPRVSGSKMRDIGGQRNQIELPLKPATKPEIVGSPVTGETISPKAEEKYGQFKTAKEVEEKGTEKGLLEAAQDRQKAWKDYQDQFSTPEAAKAFAEKQEAQPELKGEAGKTIEGEGKISPPEGEPLARTVLSDLTDKELLEYGKKHGITADAAEFAERDERRHRTGRANFVNKILEKMGPDEQAKLASAASDFDTGSNMFTEADLSSKTKAERARTILQAHEALKGNKPVSGGSQGAAAAPERAGTEEGAKRDTELFQQAKAELGEGASISQIAQRAQELKTAGKEYAGPERREQPRTLLTGKDLVDAIASRKPMQTPFDVTEGGMDTLKADKNMPKSPAEELADLKSKAKELGLDPEGYGNLNKPARRQALENAVKNAQEGLKPSMENTRLSDEELKAKGWTQEQLDNGEHLPTVSGAKKLTKTEAKKLAEEHLTEEERESVNKTETKAKKFVDTLTKLPSVQELTDIAKLGEGARKWYQRSQEAIQHMAAVAPHYFDKEGDVERFTGLLASSSPRQAVAMNVREALEAWKNYVDAGRPEGKALEKLLTKTFTNAGGKVPNAMKALSGQPLWPDLTKNRAFKVPSFDANLKGVLDKVTNDGWMALFHGLDPRDLSNPENYHPLSVITRAAAKELGWQPAEAQAAIWSFVKTFVEKGGETSPHNVKHFSEDMADIVKHDPQTRELLKQLGADLNDVDKRIDSIQGKEKITAGYSPTAERSVGKLAKRIENVKGEAPRPKDTGLFDRLKENELSFNPDDFESNEVAPLEPAGRSDMPQATRETSKMSNEELLAHGFTQNEIDEGKHLPSVGGGSQDSEETHAPIWYSKAERIANEKLPGKGTGDQMLSTLKNNGVKGDELEHTGLEGFLKGKDKLTKQDVVDYIKKNGISLEETTKGETNKEAEAKAKAEWETKKAQKDKLSEEYNKLTGVFDDKRSTVFSKMEKAGIADNYAFSEALDGILYGNDTKKAHSIIELANMLDNITHVGEKIPTITGEQSPMFPEDIQRRPSRRVRRFMQSVHEPEPRITPEEASDLKVALGDLMLASQDRNRVNSQLYSVGHVPSEFKFQSNNPVRYASYSLKGPKENYREKLIQIPKKEGEKPYFYHGHWEEPNIVAHVRYDNRVDADGKKNLFLEELQSDLHREGSKKGYSSNAQVDYTGYTAKRASDAPYAGWYIYDANGNKQGELSYYGGQSEEEALQTFKENQEHQDDKVLNAPFKKDWHEMAVKRMLREAAEQGVDRLSWTTGKQQADRYSLSNHVDKIEYDPENNILNAYKRGDRVVQKELDSPEALKDHIGADLAKKLLEQKPRDPHIEIKYEPDKDPDYPYVVYKEGQEYDSSRTQEHAQSLSDQAKRHKVLPYLEGQNLEMGGEWAKALYDRAIPNFLNKYLKKFDIKVGETKMNTGERDIDSRDVHNAEPRLKELSDKLDHVEGQEYDKILDEYHKLYEETFNKLKAEPHKEKVHTIEMTPELKKHLLKEGQPIARQEAEPMGEKEQVA